MGEALVIVDTDLGVPAFVNRLRIDVYSSDASTWYGSHDTSRASPSDWPASFGLYAPDAASTYSALVRLRAYADGSVRDYRGERYLPRPSPSAPPLGVPALPEGDGQPRILDAEGNDLTPSSEPEPELAIDRLVQVVVPAATRGAVRILLHGACVGTMADLGDQNSCVDTEGTLAAVTTASLDPDVTVPSQSVQGTFGAQIPCTATPRPASAAADGSPLYDEEICVPGELFILGSPDGSGTLPDLPRRVAFVPPLRIDKYEVTVARWRAALASGFVGPDLTPTPNEGPLPTLPPAGGQEDNSLCTWSASAQGREAYPVNCVTRTSARELCAWIGAALPTEAEWEYVAAAAGRPYRSRYPWAGDDSTEPDCTRAVFSRGSMAGENDLCRCATGQTTDCGFGPAPVSTDSSGGGDVTPSGIVGLGGSLAEIVRDAAAPLGANCWVGSPILSPGCVVQFSTPMTFRGGSWAMNRLGLPAGSRAPFEPNELSTALGFRCVRPGTGP